MRLDTLNRTVQPQLMKKHAHIKNPFKHFTKFELALWIGSVFVVTLSFIISSAVFSQKPDYLTLTASLIGVTSLIFIAKGMVIGPVLCVVFSVFYGIVSYFEKYYGEMITYLAMTTPICILSIISWLKHPNKKTASVEIGKLTKKAVALMIVTTAAVTVAFYFILRALGNANLIISTISVTTSFAASYLGLFRSAWCTVGYAANDIVLVVLWSVSTSQNLSCLPMVICFAVFLINDLYGFINWQKMKKLQVYDVAKNDSDLTCGSDDENKPTDRENSNE